MERRARVFRPSEITGCADWEMHATKGDSSSSDPSKRFLNTCVHKKCFVYDMCHMVILSEQLCSARRELKGAQGPSNYWSAAVLG